MQILLYSGFRKRENSTKTPLVADATRTVTGYLREPCSIMSPVFKIERFPSDASPSSFNYAYIGAFSRWYFVKDWTWADGLWQCSMEVDVLASFKTDIGNTYAYIDRCSQTYDGSITDTQYIATTNFNIESHDITTSWYNLHPGTDGCYIWGIINGLSTGRSQVGGAVTYYALTLAQSQSLMRYLLSDQFLTDAGFPITMTPAQQITNDMAKAFIKPIDYVVSCMWFPLPVSAFTSAQDDSNIDVGYWKVGQTIAKGKLVEAYTVILHCGVNVPIHPQAATRGKYLNYAPFTRLSLELPPFGLIPIDTSYCEIGSYLYCSIYVDSITGQAQLIVKLEPNDETLDDNNVVVNESTALFGVPIQLAQINADFFHAGIEAIQAGISTSGAITSALALNPYGAGVHAGQALSHVANTIDLAMPQIRTHGTNGSFLYTDIKPRINAHHFIQVDEDNAELGRPLRKQRYIRDLPGFVKCYEVTVDYPCFDQEKTRIHSYLMNGFFWE